MKIEIITTKIDDRKQIVLSRNDEIVLISRYSSRVADIVMDLLDNNGNSPLLNITSYINPDKSA